MQRLPRTVDFAALAGDREAFDQLFDRYLDRVGRYVARRRPSEAPELVRTVLQRLFATLDVEEPPLAERAYRLARAASSGTAGAEVSASARPLRASALRREPAA